MALVSIMRDFICVCDPNFLILYRQLLMFAMILDICLSLWRFDCMIYPSILTLDTWLILYPDVVIFKCLVNFLKRFLQIVISSVLSLFIINLLVLYKPLIMSRICLCSTAFQGH